MAATWRGSSPTSRARRSSTGWERPDGPRRTAGPARADRARREVDAVVVVGAHQPRRGARDAPRDAGVASGGDQAGAVGREGPRGVARQGPGGGGPDHRAGPRGPATQGD